MTGATTVLCLAFINIFGLVLQRVYVALRVRDKRKLSCLYIEILIISSSYHHLSVGSLSRLWFKNPADAEMFRASSGRLVSAGVLTIQISVRK